MRLPMEQRLKRGGYPGSRAGRERRRSLPGRWRSSWRGSRWTSGSKREDARESRQLGTSRGRVWLECDVEWWEESLGKWIGFMDGLRPPAALNLGNRAF